MAGISIIVPVYQAEKYLENCLRSIQSQTFKDWECILVNDGSSDLSGDIGSEYASKDPRIKVIHQQNQGPSVARNVGIDAATGKYLAFIDSDDTIDAEMYQTMYSLAEIAKAEVVICNYKDIGVRKNNSNVTIRTHKLPKDKLLTKDEIENKVLFSYFKSESNGIASLCNKLYLRSFIITNNLRLDIRRVRAEDWQFNMEFFQLAKKVIATDKPFYNYIHQNNQSIMASYRPNQFELYLYSRELLNNLKNKYNFQIDEAENNNIFIHDSYIFILQIIKNEKSEEGKKKFLEIVLNKKFQEAISISTVQSLSFHYRVITYLLKLKFYKSAYISFKIWSKRLL